jgi:hypothetical protein
MLSVIIVTEGRTGSELDPLSGTGMSPQTFTPLVIGGEERSNPPPETLARMHVGDAPAHCLRKCQWLHNVILRG